MPIQVLMPALSPTMTEGKLAKWSKKEGEQVASGDVLCEIETDKATMEVEAVDEGTLGRILVPDGTEGVAVNTPIALLLEEGEDASALDQAAAAAAKPAPKPAEPAQPSGADAPGSAKGTAGEASGACRRAAPSPGRRRLPNRRAIASSRARWRSDWRRKPASISPDRRQRAARPHRQGGRGEGQGGAEDRPRLRQPRPPSRHRRSRLRLRPRSVRPMSRFRTAACAR